MMLRSNYLMLLMAVFLFGMFNIGAIAPAYAVEKTHVKKLQGKVGDIINVANYTYAEIDTGSEKVWVAGPTTGLKKGDTVTFSTQMPMKDFHSESMKRSFSLIYFISRFETDGNKVTSLPTPPAHSKIEQLKTSIKGIKKVEGGNNISEIHANKEKLKDKTIRIRGQVTRFAAEIMGKNWLHIQDSSSFDDLTVTTDSTVAVGDVVIIEGKLELDKDFKYGYVYPVIVQNAKVLKE